MIPLNPIANGQSQLPAAQLQAIDHYVPPAASQNETQRPVSTPTPHPEIQNNTRGGPFSTSSAANPTAAALSLSLTGGIFISPIPAALNGTGGASPFFFAQLLGQGVDAQSQHILMDYESIIQQAANRNQPQVQFANPTLSSSFQQLLQEQTPESKVLLPAGVVQQAANSNTPLGSMEGSKNMAALFPVQIKSSGTRATNETHVRMEPTSLKGSRSLVRQQGSAAYFATDVRNILELEIVPAVGAVA